MSESADAVAIAAAKTTLRQAVRLRRATRTPEHRGSDDQQRFDRMRAALAARSTRRLAGYLSAGTEPDTQRLIAWAVAHDIEVLLPVVTDAAGSWLTAPAWAAYEGPDHLREGRAQILEPTGRSRADGVLDTVDLLVMPGLAADSRGNRLGRGGGWYDRARAGRADVPTWLLLNDDEVVEVVPTAAWDLPVDLLVTPTRLIPTR